MTHPIPAISVADAVRMARETRQIALGAGVLGETPRVFREEFGERAAIVVADPNTYAAAGHLVDEAFRRGTRRRLAAFVFADPDLVAEQERVEELADFLRAHDGIPVAVGSGTVNDVTKLAAHWVGRPYLSVATAASMDGYAAFGASITRDGSKQSVPCPAPTAVVADLDVLGAAPAIMNAWGYADLMAKITAGADWLLAEALEVEPVHPQAWNLVQGGLRAALADPAGVKARHPTALGRLVEGLMLSGFAMQAAQSSRPASGAEHQFSHLWDMQHHRHQGRIPSHGLKVGLGTLAITALYERLLDRPLERLDVDACVARWPDEGSWARRAQGWFGEGSLAAVARRELSAKAVTPATLRAQLQKLRAGWDQVRERLRAQLLPFAVVRDRLATVGACTEPEMLGFSRVQLRASFWPAFCIRRRFTVLDLAARLGVLDDCLEQIFGDHGVWPIPTPASAATPHNP